MFPILFDNKQKALEFHSGVIAYQLYNKYSAEFRKIAETKKTPSNVNIKLLLSLGYCFAK